jgi:hypothetical protein
LEQFPPKVTSSLATLGLGIEMRDYSLHFHKNMKDIGSDILLDCNDELVFQQEAICSEI